jgi:hypothetical protein
MKTISRIGVAWALRIGIMSASQPEKQMATKTNAQKLIDQARERGSLTFIVGRGSGNTLHTLRALRRAGIEPTYVSGSWQGRNGITYRINLTEGETK